MAAVKKNREGDFPLRPDSWYLVVYYDGDIRYLSIPSSNKTDLERLLILVFGFEISGLPHRVFGVSREGVFELGRGFFERLEKEMGIDLRKKAERDVEELLDELGRMEKLYARLGFVEDLEEVAEMKDAYGEYLKKLREAKGRENSRP
ncbi:hypothetical protein [Thermococcus zilligii]|uniref:hypothetical protein n=1 Tax=Thermococcus zilligii TaxID=54076 RepID=UPI00029A16F2|nr:hypothetical protein [Thermococcus zilligii]